MSDELREADGLAAAIALIQDTARKADEARTIHVPGDGRLCYVQHGAEIKTFAVPPTVRHHKMFALDDLIAYVTGDVPTKPVIYHSHDAIVLVLDDNDRRDQVTLHLAWSRAFAELLELDSKTRLLDQRAFCRLLRFGLGVPAAIVQPFRRMEWRSGDNLSAEHTTRGDRLGRDISAEASGVAELPEEITVSTPVYEQRGCRLVVSIRCEVEIATAEQRLAIRPLPGEIQTACDLVHAEIAADIRQGVDDEVPIYYGMPSG